MSSTFGNSGGFAFGSSAPITPVFGGFSTTTNTFGSGATNGWGQTQPAPTPAFGQSQTTSAPPATAGDPAKGQMLACLTESKNIQAAILQEIKLWTSRFSNSGVVHSGVSCNVCNKCNITGNRYKCFFCKDFDMCEECEAKPGGHDPSHVFLKIKDTVSFNAKIATCSGPFQL